MTVNASLSRKALVGAAVAGLAVIIGVAAFLPGSDFSRDISAGVTLPAGLGSSPDQIEPLGIQLDELSVLQVSEKEAYLNLKFIVTNPNDKPVLLQIIRYKIFESDQRVAAGQIGERLTGFATGSNYFTILKTYPTTIGEKVTIKNTGDNPEFWSALTDNTANWRVEGEAFFSISSAMTGTESSVTFDFQI